MGNIRLSRYILSKIPECLETDRLILRPLTRSDFPDFFSFIRNERSTRYLSFTKEQKTYQGSRDLLDLIVDRYGRKNQIFLLAVVREKDNRYVGMVGLFPIKIARNAEIFYSLLPTFRGKGYAAEASHRLLAYGFTELGLERMVAYIFPTNEPSAKVAKRIRMKDEGFVLRKQHGRQVRLRLYSMTRDEFFT
jgi:[ribosomal protein S5]-alanine N-acetyltransferase